MLFYISLLYWKRTKMQSLKVWGLCNLWFGVTGSSSSQMHWQYKSVFIVEKSYSWRRWALILYRIMPLQIDSNTESWELIYKAAYQEITNPWECSDNYDYYLSVWPHLKWKARDRGKTYTHKHRVDLFYICKFKKNNSNKFI